MATAKKSPKKPAPKKPEGQESAINGFKFRAVVKAPKIMGKVYTSRMVRIDGEFADWLREEAKRSNTSVTEVSRSIYQSLT